MTHLGAHVAMSVPLRFPFGSIGRLIWTLAFRLSAEWRAIVWRRDDEAVRGARRIHTLPVMLLAALPGAGAVAYVAAEPVRRNRPLLAVLVDQAGRKLPLRLYEKLHLPELACWIACSAPQEDASRTGVRLPRLSGVVWAARTAFASLAPHRGLIASVLAFNALAAALAFGVGLARGDFIAPFRPFGPIQVLYSAELLLTGVLGHRIFARYWQRQDTGADPNAPGIFFWLISGWGFAWLALDDFFEVHERLGRLLEGYGAAIPLLNHADDTVVFLYGVAAVGLIYLFYGHLRASRAPFTLLALGFLWTGFYLTVDFFVPEGTVLAGLEEPANLAVNAFFLSAYLVKYREISQAGKRADCLREAPSQVAAQGP